MATSTTQLATTAFSRNAVAATHKAGDGRHRHPTGGRGIPPVIALTASDLWRSTSSCLSPSSGSAIYTPTTGAFGVTVKTAAGTGVAAAQASATLFIPTAPTYDGFNDFGQHRHHRHQCTAPTAAVGTNTTQLATTAFVSWPGRHRCAAKIDGAAAVVPPPALPVKTMRPTDTSQARWRPQV